MPPVARITRGARKVSPSVSTPATRPFSISSCRALPRRTSTPRPRIQSSSARVTSSARSDTGKTRFPRSVFRGTPRSSKKDFTASGGKPQTLLYRNRPPVGTFFSTSSGPQSLQTLQRPFPVIRSFFPNSRLRSSRSTRFREAAAVPAENIPAAPPPTTIRS